MGVGKLLTRRAYSAIGLDLGEGSLRAAQLYRRGDRWTVSMLGACRMPRGGEWAMGDAAVRARAGRWLRQLDVKRQTVVAGLSPPDVEIHAMRLVPLEEGADERQARGAAQAEIGRLMSFPDGGAVTDFWRLPTNRPNSSTAIGVAGAQDRVNDSVALCRLARLDCVGVDASACALARFGAAYRGRSARPDEAWAVLDLGARMSRLIVCVDETPVLARVFTYGGASWTQQLASSLSVSEDTAERHKCDFGISRKPRAADRSPGTAQASGVLGEMIYNVLRSDLDLIASEIERSYRYVLQSYAAKQPGPLILAGGGASLCNLASLFAEKIGIEVIVPTIEGRAEEAFFDFEPVRARMREPICNFACAIGLAIGDS